MPHIQPHGAMQHVVEAAQHNHAKEQQLMQLSMVSQQQQLVSQKMDPLGALEAVSFRAVLASCFVWRILFMS